MAALELVQLKVETCLIVKGSWKSLRLMTGVMLNGSHVVVGGEGGGLWGGGADCRGCEGEG